MRDHTKLRAFELADQLVLLVYKETVSFPTYEQFGLTSQLRRASVSIASNIVEGCARHSEADYLRFLDMAYSSSREVQYQITIATRLDYGNKVSLSALETHAIESSKVLNGLIRSLRKGKFPIRLPPSAFSLTPSAFFHHPHIHALVPGGGPSFNKDNDPCWVTSRDTTRA